MKVNRDVQASTFQKGMSLDPSDIVLPNDVLRFAQNLRIYNREGSAFVATNLQGTEQAFTLSAGFTPVAAQEFAGVLYLISWHADGRLELGSYPSPNYSNPGSPNDSIYVYRPINNLDGGPFTTNALGTATKPVIQKLEIQPDYDESVNMCFTIVGQRPRIVNVKFKAENNGTQFSILADRNNESSAASGNSYTTDSVNKETSLILFSQKILQLAFQGLRGGGKLKTGNYHYVFYYMTEDFNRTAVVAQSSLCQVAFGEGFSSMRGGDETQETNKKSHFRLTNIDTDFRYLKVYFMYSSGQDALQQQYIEITKPLEITGETMDFYHTGFEETTEVSQDEVNVDYASIESAACSTQVGGYYFLADIKQRTILFDNLRSITGSLEAKMVQTSLSINSVGFPAYTDPLNVYNYLGYMNRETYPFSVVYIMNDGSLSPAFPVKSMDFTNGNVGIPSLDPANQQKGLITFPLGNLAGQGFFDEVTQSIVVRHLEFNLNLLRDDAFVANNTIGCFIVRGERRPNRLTQGILIPTIKAPTIEAPDGPADSDPSWGADTGYGSSEGTINFNGYYGRNAANIDDINVFKHLINLDGVIESFIHKLQSEYRSVLNNVGAVDKGYMACWLPLNLGNYGSTGYPAPNIWKSKSTEAALRHWALLSGEAFVNEPEYITQLQRENMGIHQLAKINFKVEGAVEPMYNGFGSPTIPASFGCHYNMTGIANFYLGGQAKAIKKTVYVPGESLATGTDFISKIKVALLSELTSTNSGNYWINQWFNSYFGVELLNDTGPTALIDIGPGPTNPIPNNNRPGREPLGASGLDVYRRYDNLNKTVPAAFLVNIYPQNQILTADELYPTVDGIVYKQISERMAWRNSAGVLIDRAFTKIYGGDCFISKVTRKLSHSPERDPSAIQTDPAKRWGIDSGMIISWWQESKYNLHLRQPKQYDVSELEKRSFFPYRSLGDPIQYRKYRLPETTAHSPGYSEVLTPKSFFGVSPLTPYERTRFMNRIYHSEKHIPNAFRNGFRSFLETSFRDYDAGMGSIKALFNHRGMLLVVFEHGIGITSIEQRIQTGADAAGAIFVEPSGILPPTLSYYSREIGCQDHLSLVQTPGAVYGVDRAKDKIWRVTDNFEVISDTVISSWLIENPIVNPRSGYDFENNEVIFTTNNWALCYTEGLRVFTSFYTFTDASFFARRNKEMYSFIGSTAYKHNSDSLYSIYGTQQEVIVEMVVNKMVSAAKVVDYLNIISNEVAPTKVEVYSYNQDVDVVPTIVVGNLNQYTKVEYEISAITEEPTMLYRDKKYVVQIPYRQNYNPGTPEDKWGLEGRVRDKVVIVRLTYVTDKPLELASVLSYFRYSQS